LYYSTLFPVITISHYGFVYQVEYHNIIITRVKKGQRRIFVSVVGWSKKKQTSSTF